MIPGEVAWASLAARILVADLVGDRECVEPLLRQLLAEHPERVRSAMLLWCDATVQAAQVIPAGGVPAAVSRWAGELLAARSDGDDEAASILLRLYESEPDTTSRVEALLDACGTVIASASGVQLADARSV